MQAQDLPGLRSQSIGKSNNNPLAKLLPTMEMAPSTHGTCEGVAKDPS